MKKNIHTDTMCLLYKQGQTTSDIALRYGLTRQRIHQIISRNGVSAHNGGIHIKSMLIKIRHINISNKEKEDKCLRKYGCSVEEYQKIMKGKAYVNRPQCAAYAYGQQKRNALDRGIPFILSFVEWYKIWTDSGKHHMRGKRNGCFVMARNGDKGAYAYDNVKIIECGDNVKEGYINRGFPILSKEEKRDRHLKYIREYSKTKVARNCAKRYRATLGGKEKRRISSRLRYAKKRLAKM